MSAALRSVLVCPGYLAHGSSKLPCERCGHLLKSHPAFQFPGGTVALPPPSREALLLSAQQWVNAVSGELHELLACLDRGYAIERSDVSLAAMQRQLDHVKRILAELGGVL